MLQITGLVFNGSIWLRISGDITSTPHICLHGTDRSNYTLILVIVTRYVANYWVGVWYVGLLILLLLILFRAVRRKIHTLGM